AAHLTERHAESLLLGQHYVVVSPEWAETFRNSCRLCCSQCRFGSPSSRATALAPRSSPRESGSCRRSQPQPGPTWISSPMTWARIATCAPRSEEHTSELQSLAYLVCRLLLEK